MTSPDIPAFPSKYEMTIELKYEQAEYEAEYKKLLTLFNKHSSVRRMKNIEAMPDRETQYGRAWRVNLTASRLHVGAKTGDDAVVCGWVVYAPWAHPIWANYWILCIHLRSCPNMPEPKINLEGATHEVFVYALNPEETPDLLHPDRTRLNPLNFAGQWMAGTDLDAEEKIERTVDEILAGTLSPDTDFLRDWVRRFSGSNLKGWDKLPPPTEAR